MKKSVIFWVLAVIITLTAAVYQRMTGPTYPKRIKLEHNDEHYNLKMPRSHVSSSDCPIQFEINNPEIHAVLEYKKYPSNDEWTNVNFEQKEGLIASVPAQPPAGKIMYKVKFIDANNNLIKEEKSTIRFKGDVPAWVLGPHIFFMFFTMLFSNAAGIFAIGKNEKYRLYTNLAFLFLIIGGMILGPFVQKYAFGELWTGVPFGWDLTDNKTLIGFAAWASAVAFNWKKDRPIYSIIAAIVLLMVYSIPHSMFGSELNYDSGVIGQG